MGGLLDWLDGIVDIGEIYARHGIKGCLLSVLVVVLIIGFVIVLALMLG